MATIRAGCDMDEVTGLDCFEPVPDTAWHDVHASPARNRTFVSTPTVCWSPSSRISSIAPLTTYRNSSPSGWTSPCDRGPSILGIAPIVYPSIRRGGPRGADLMVIDQSRAMSATLPSKWTSDAFEAVIIRPDCLFWNHRAPVLQCLRPERFLSGNEAVTHHREGGACSQATSGTLVGVFEHFTDNARRVLVLAQEEARDLDASSIDPVHLLLGMVREGESIAAKALSAVGADYYLAREIIEDDDAQESELRSASRAFSIATMRIIEKSVKISWDRADGGIDTEHLLVALLEEQDDAIEDVLAGLDVTPQEIEQCLDTLLAEQDSVADPLLPRALALSLGSDRSQQLELLEGVLWGIDHLDEVIELLRTSANRGAARDVLMAPPFELSQNQTTGVLDLSVGSVTVERRKQVLEEIDVLRQGISDE